MSEVSAPNAPIAARPRRAPRQTGWTLPRVLLGNKVAFLAFCYLLLVVVVAIFAPLIAPHDPNAQDIANRLTPPAWSSHGTSAHILGTDQLGRDTFSRIIFASRLSLLVGVAVVSVTLVVGVLLGLIAGLFGGRTDHAIMAVTDVIMAFPGLLMVMTVAALMGPGLGTVIAALSVRYWTSFARITRGMVISLTKTDF
ncbi:MAG TPA: ABC transporter permease, partial [Micromonosporaceae bacterium]